MAILELLEFIGKQNIAEDIEPDKLAILGMRVKRQFDEDWGSMKDWMEGVDQGMKLMKQEFHPKSTPWDGASNFKSPLLTEASIAFGDKASLEILRARNLVKADIIGRDKEGKKKESITQPVRDLPTWLAAISIQAVCSAVAALKSCCH